jgi:hypothetical protein
VLTFTEFESLTTIISNSESSTRRSRHDDKLLNHGARSHVSGSAADKKGAVGWRAASLRVRIRQANGKSDRAAFIT